MRALQVYLAHRLYSVFHPSPDHYVIGYNDRVVGLLHQTISGPHQGWYWSLYDATPQPEWRRGIAPTYDDAKRVIAARFRQWVEEAGDPKPYRYRSPYDVPISERLAGRQPVWPPAV